MDFVRSQRAFHGATIACHILPFSSNDFQQPSESLDMIAAWGSFDVRKLTGLKINGPSNGLLLRADIGPMISNFKLWFEKAVCHQKSHLFIIAYICTTSQDGPDTYTVKAGDVFTEYAGKVVTFISEHSEGIDLPDPQILELHAAFSRVLYLTGAGKYFEAYLRDMDELRVLASDGSTRLDSLLYGLGLMR
jgi:hypothetical protein